MRTVQGARPRQPARATVAGTTGPTAPPGGTVVGGSPPEPAPDEEAPSFALAAGVTTAVCAAVAVLAHAVLWWGLATGRVDDGVWWAPVVGIALVTVSVVAFGGFYLATRRTRVAVTAAFVLTFFVLFSFALTITQLGEDVGDEPGLAADLFADYRTILTTVVAFYFGAETLISLSKVYATSRATDEESKARIAGADRDTD